MSSPPRILHLIDTGGPGGAETVFLSLAAHGEARGHNAAAVVPHDGWLAGQLRAAGVAVTVLPSRGSLNLGFLRRLVSLARAGGARLIHAHLLGSAVYGALAGLWLRIPVIAVFHGATDLRDPGRFDALKRWLVLRPHVHVVAVSAAVREALADWGLPASRILLIRNGVDTTRFSPGSSRLLHEELGLPPDALIVGAVGNVRPAKAYEVMVEAARHVVAADPRVHFAISGQGSEADLAALRTQAATAGVAGHVHFLGFQPSSAERCRSFGLFGSSARTEGLPLSFLEAMACGIPIAATDNEGAGPLLRETGAGLLSPVGDPKALADSILAILGDPGLAARLGAAGRQAACDTFSLEQTLAEYQALYERVGGSGQP